MNILSTGIILFTVFFGLTSGRNVPQPSAYQSQLFSDMMNDLRNAYESKLNDVHKRLALQEHRYTELLEILKGSHRERRHQDGNVPHSSTYQSQLFSDMMNDLRTAYETKLNRVNKRVAAQEERYNNLVKLLLGSGRERRLLAGLQLTTPVPPSQQKIAFFAQLSHDLTGIGNFQPIVFDHVTTNVGNGYNKVNGMFTANAPGTYVFSWTTASVDNHHMQTELVVNNKRIGLTWSDSGNHADYAIASDTAVLSLKVGDVVWVRSTNIHGQTLHGQQMSTFSGWILFSE